jgi:N-acetyl-anhydromuramyl-L-alanine amidase AmpD
MKETFKQSPNISQRAIFPEGIVLHHTAGSYAGSVNWCLNPNSQVSYHCIVDTNGDRTILSKDNQRAWHAGVSSFRGRSNCNDFLLGIAVSLDTNTRELTPQEIESVACWCIDKMQLYGFGIEMITTHREISAPRKNDVDLRAEFAIRNFIYKTL